MRKVMVVLAAAAVCVVFVLLGQATAGPIEYEAGGNTYTSHYNEGTEASPTTLDVYVQSGVLDAGQTDTLTAGINAWTSVMPGVDVTIHDGDPPDPHAQNTVTVTFDQQFQENHPDGDWGEGGSFGDMPDPPPPDGSTLDYTYGEIVIDTDAITNETYLQNLSQHEFGHILGLDDTDNEDDAMDPDVPDDKLMPLSPEDLDSLRELYTVIPEPAGLGLIGLAMLAVRTRRR